MEQMLPDEWLILNEIDAERHGAGKADDGVEAGR